MPPALAAAIKKKTGSAPNPLLQAAAAERVRIASMSDVRKGRFAPKKKTTAPATLEDKLDGGKDDASEDRFGRKK